MKETEKITVKPPYIKLEQFLKLAAAVPTGGTAKQVILDELVRVDGEICTMRGKKLKGGETIEYDGKTYTCEIQPER